MRLRLALLAIPLALLAALFVYFVQPRLGAAPAAGSTVNSPALVANPSGGAAPSASSLSGVGKMDPSSPGAAETTPTLLKAITVVGQGEAKVAPDVAYVGIGVRTREKTAKEAQDKNNQAMAAVIAKIKALGIDEKDIQTSGISLYPAYESSGTLISGYDASNNVTIRTDVAKVGSVLDGAVEAGANSNVSVSFALKDPSTATAQALEAATKDARVRADAIAKGLGVSVKEVQIAVEETTSSPIIMRDASAYNLASAEAKMAPTPIQPGEMTVTSRVRVTYTY